MIACLWKDPLLIDETELTQDDFLTKDGSFYFGLAKTLRKKGFVSFDEVTVISNMNEKIADAFESRGGWESVQNFVDVINVKNWDTYIDILYRENIIKSLVDNGFNVQKPILIDNKKIIPLELFRKMDSESVIDWYESRLSSFGTGYSSKVLEEEEIEITDEFIKDCMDGMENGVPFDIAGEDINGESMNCLPFVSNQISGLMDGTLTMLGGYSSTGKSSLWVTILMALIHYGRKCLIISNEQKCKVFKISFIVWIAYKHFRYYSLSRKKLTSGDLTEEDQIVLHNVQEYWNNNYKGKVKFIGIPDADMSLVKKKIRENVLRYGYDTVLYETFKLDFSEKDQKAYISLLQDSREFDKIAKKYNIIMLCSLQLAINTLGKLFLDSSVLSNSKQIKEVLENLFLMRTVYQEEIDPENKLYCRPFRLVKRDDKWIEEEYVPDPMGTYRMLFVDKTRSGYNSSDNGVAYLLKFNGNQCIFREVAQCRPKHGYLQ